MIIKSIEKAVGLAGKTIFLRADLNVPIKNKTVKDDYKIIMSLPTIRFLLRHKCRVLISTHLSAADVSAKPIVARLEKYLDKKVKFAPDYFSAKTKKTIAQLKAGEVVLLENLRFNQGEEKNDSRFARQLAGLADFYVNDAFAVCHRRHASVVAIKKYLPSYAGLLLKKEIVNLEKIIKPRQPLIAIIGGVKIETKIALLKSLAKRSHRLLIGGALANNFIAAHGYEVGRSVTDKASLGVAASLIRHYQNIILPVDAVVGKKMDTGQTAVRLINQVKPDEIILDIGPKTVKLFAHFIRQANTIIWNGPLGYFENKHTKFGTLSVARLVAARSTGQAFGAVGGGETIAALRMTKMENYIDWVSTGGGAMLTFLGGEPMPGLSRLVK